MKKRFAIACSLFFLSFVMSAQSYSTKTGIVQFEASVPSFEEVAAINKGVSAILKADTGQFACLTLVKGFRFKMALMEEHFNENYAESDTFPKTTFKGTLVNFNAEELSTEPKEFIAKGTLTFHGVSKNVEIPVKLKRLGEAIDLSTEFILDPSDFDIKIPNIVRSKIAEEIIVQLALVLKS